MAHSTLELEFCDVAGSPWEGTVRVRFGGEASEPFHVREGLTLKERAELRWYLEEYMLFPEVGNVSRAEAVQQELARYGSALWEQLARGDTAGRVNAWLGLVHASGGGRLELRATKPGDEIAFRSPWELMRTGGTQGKLLHTLGVTVVRRSNAVLPRLPLPDTAEGLRVLAVVCRPDETGFLDPRYTPQAILDALHKRPEVSVEFCRPPTLAALTERLRLAQEEKRPYHVVHFDGHGTTLDEEGGIGALCFERDDGSLDLVRAARFGDLIATYHVPLVVLEACRTSMQVFAQATVAGALLRQGVGSVLAMGYAVHVDMTRELMDAFYAAIARGQSLGAAVSAGRERLFAKPHRRVKIGPDAEEVELHDWFVPQLYQGGEDPTLLPPTSARKKSETARDPIWAGFLGEPRAGFQGRGRELHRLERAIGEHAVVVLHAPGGMGKSALSREAAHWWVRTGLFPDGAIFVSFETAASPEAVVQQVGQALEGLEFLNRKDGGAWVESQLEMRRLLVVWDNYESVLPAFNGGKPTPPELAELARRWTRGKSRLLVTCRDAETGLDAWPSALGGLSEPEALFLLVRMLDRLGIDRRARKQRGWTRETLQPIVERTGGHPLALELLAPQIPLLGPVAVAKEMQELLAEAEQAHPEGRNRSMAASLDFSLRHLSKETRAALPAVALLSGGCLETMAHMAVGLEPKAWAAMRAELERTGLLRANGPVLLPHPVLADAPGLAPSPEQVERFLDVVLALSVEFDKLVRTTNAKAALFAFASSEAVLRRAVDLAARAGQVDRAWAIADSLNTFLVRSGRGSDGGRLMTMLQERARTSGSELTEVAATLEREAGWAQASREPAAAVLALEHLLNRLASATNWDTRSQRAHTLMTLGRVLYGFAGRPTEALTRLEQSMPLMEELEREGKTDTVNRSAVQGDLTNVLRMLGRLDEALMFAEQALELDRQRKDPSATARALGQMAQILKEAGRLREAEERYHEAMKAAQDAGDTEAEGITWQQLGGLALDRNEPEQAAGHLRRSLAALQRAESSEAQVTVFNLLGIVEQQRGNLEAALAWFGKSLEQAQSVGDLGGEVAARSNRATIFSTQVAHEVDPVRARELLHRSISEGREVLELQKRISTPHELALAHSNLAHRLLQVAELDEAEQHARQALTIAMSIHDRSTWRPLAVLEGIAKARGDAAAATEYRRRKEAAQREAVELAGAPPLRADLVTALLQAALLARAQATSFESQLRARGADDEFISSVSQAFPWLVTHLRALATPKAQRPAASVPAAHVALLDAAWDAAR